MAAVAAATPSPEAPSARAQEAKTPPHAEVSTSSISEQDKTFLRTNVLPQIVENIKESIDLFARWEITDSLEQEKAFLAKVEAHKDDEHYLNGLLFLRGFGVNIVAVGSHIEPSVLMDRAFLQNRLDAIPPEVRNTFVMNAREFTRDPPYDAGLYANQEFVHTAHALSTRGMLWTSSQIEEIIVVGKNTTSFLDGLAHLHAHGVLLHSWDVAAISETAIQDPTFIQSLVTLQNGGIDVSKMLSTTQGDEGLTHEKARSVAYVDSVIRLHNAGINEYELRNSLSLAQRPIGSLLTILLYS